MLVCFSHPQGVFYENARQAAVVLLSVFLLVSPFPHTQSIGEFCFYLSLLIFVILSFRFGLKSEHHDAVIALLLFSGWSLFASVFALDPSASLHDLYSHQVKYIILTIMLVFFFGNRGGMIRLTWVVVVAGTLFSIVILGYFYGVLGRDLSERLGTGLLRWPIDPMGFVMLFSLAFIPALYKHSGGRTAKPLLAFMAVVVVVAAILTQSRATIIGLVAVICFSFYRSKKLLAVVLSLTLSFAFVVTPIVERFKQGDTPRVALILYTLEVILDHPVAGIGFSLDTFREPALIDPQEYSNRIPEKYRNVVEFHWPHNMLLEVAVRTGIIGVFLFGFFFALIFKKAGELARYGRDWLIKDWALAILAAISMFVIKGFFENVFMHFVEVVLYVNLAMLIILSKLQRKC